MAHLEVSILSTVSSHLLAQRAVRPQLLRTAQMTLTIWTLQTALLAYPLSTRTAPPAAANQGRDHLPHPY